MKTIAALLMLTVSMPAFAQDMPVPKMFKGIQGEKGQWRMEILEGGGRAAAKGMTITLCTDNLFDSANKNKPKGESSCKHRLLKDTADEAVVESECKERKTVVTLKRESAKSMLMTMESTGPKGPQTMKMRYSHLGPCREGQGTMSFDKDSEQCKKMRERAAKMDPAKQCARQKSEREACEQRIRETAEKLSAMCS
jgi:hypothetical protein